MPSDSWTSDLAYEPYIGRWSRLVAPRFLRWLPACPAAGWCDVGCGTGALARAIVDGERPRSVLGVDPSAAYLAAARGPGLGLAVAPPPRCPPGTLPSTGWCPRSCSTSCLARMPHWPRCAG
jgi:SAM-dependent methyltransferase